MENSQYTLYVKAGCPFCAKVLNFMDEHDIVLPIMDISLEPYKDGYDKLINLGGKYQVPCLDIDGKALYESDDIIAYLNKTFVEKNQDRIFDPCLKIAERRSQEQGTPAKQHHQNQKRLSHQVQSLFHFA